MSFPARSATTRPSADELDESQSTTGREIGWATRELLVERVNPSAHETQPDRLREGTYVIFAECHEPISPARLHAMLEFARPAKSAARAMLRRLDYQVGRGSRERLFALTETE